MASSMEEQSQDLSTCCICMNCYNEEDHKPKYLVCHHTFCLKCIQAMLVKAGTYYRLSCPVCKKVCKVPNGAESLSSNIYALHIAKLTSGSKKEQNWCLECDMILESKCLQLKHKSISLMEEVKDIEGQLIAICTQLKESVGRRERVNEHLGQKKVKLETELKSIQVEMVNNHNCLEKLCLMISNCHELSKMSPSIKTSKVVRKKVKRTWQEAQNEAKQSGALFKSITAEDKEPCAKKPCPTRSVASSQLLNPAPGASISSTQTLPPNQAPVIYPSLIAQKATAQKIFPRILLGIPTATGKVSVDITRSVYQAVQKGLVVSHEPRSLTVDLGVHGRFVIMIQIDSNGPRVLSTTSLPPKPPPRQLIAVQ